MLQTKLELSWSNRCVSCKRSKDFTVINHIQSLICNNPESESYQQKIEYPDTTTCECWRYMA